MTAHGLLISWATDRDANGGYAEYMAVLEDFAYKIPDDFFCFKSLWVKLLIHGISECLAFPAQLISRRIYFAYQIDHALRGRNDHYAHKDQRRD